MCAVCLLVQQAGLQELKRGPQRILQPSKPAKSAEMQCDVMGQQCDNAAFGLTLALTMLKTGCQDVHAVL